MDVLTSREVVDGDGIWSLAPSIPRGLHQAISTGARVLLYCDDPSRDMEEILAVVELYRRAGGDPDFVAAATAYPFEGWIELLRARGVNRIYLVRKPPARYDTTVSADSLHEIAGVACPHLHARRVGGGPLSVCGMRFDCLVLGDREYSRWCLADWRACPHLRATAASGAMPMAACART